MHARLSRSIALLTLAVSLTAGAAAASAHPDAAGSLRDLSDALSAHSGDLSLLLASSPDDMLAGLRERPDSTGLVQVASEAPAIRIHYAPAPLPGLADADLDGVPDRVFAAQRAARTTLDVCARLGLGAPADDGDGELDIYLVPLGGLARGFAVVEGPLPPGRGGYGFAVADPSTHFDEHAFKGMVARAVARLVLAARDAEAPGWWSEASALWIEERANGTSPDIARALHARWSRPELGLSAGMPLLLRGNAGLLWALDAPPREAAALRATWRALEARTGATSADEIIIEALERSAGSRLAELQLRAGIRQTVHGQPPSRWALDVGAQGLPGEARLWVAPRGAALVRLAGAGAGESARVHLAPDDASWKATLIARRGAGAWDRVPVTVSGEGHAVVLPWNDYDEAVLILARSADAREGGGIRVGVTPASRGALFGLSSFGARTTAMSARTIRWESSWEDGLFGWIVERAVGAEGAWEPLSDIPLPALGDERQGSAYTLYDDQPIHAELLRYRLVAVTAEGLRVSGPAIVIHR